MVIRRYQTLCNFNFDEETSHYHALKCNNCTICNILEINFVLNSSCLKLIFDVEKVSYAKLLGNKTFWLKLRIIFFAYLSYAAEN